MEEGADGWDSLKNTPPSAPLTASATNEYTDKGPIDKTSSAKTEVTRIIQNYC